MVTGSPTLALRLPSLHIQAQEQCSRPWILHGMGEEGGEPIYGQAHGFRGGRLPRQLFCQDINNNKIHTQVIWN